MVRVSGDFREWSGRRGHEADLSSETVWWFFRAEEQWRETVCTRPGADGPGGLDKGDVINSRT